MFLHLSDAALDADETHFTSHEEPRSTPAPQHQCSVCQDHQHLVLDVSAASDTVVEGRPQVVATTAALVYDFQPLALAPSRAPPRN